MSRGFLRFVTHPEVAIRADVPVTDWGLSELGQRRAHGLTSLDWPTNVRSMFSSRERKAVQTAAVLSAAIARPSVVVGDLGENDRSSTGYLPPDEFERTADRFFAEPQDSVRGWEAASAAQQRIVAAVDRCLAASDDGDVVVVSHGGVGALLLCHLAARPIDRQYDQPGQGSYFTVNRSTMSVTHGWMRIPLPPAA